MNKHDAKVAQMAIIAYTAMMNGSWDSTSSKLEGKINREAYENTMMLLNQIDMEAADVIVKCPYLEECGG